MSQKVHLLSRGIVTSSIGVTILHCESEASLCEVHATFFWNIPFWGFGHKTPIIERFWRVLRRRATHNRLFASMAVLRTTLRNNLSYFQTMRQKVLSLIESPRKTKKKQR